MTVNYYSRMKAENKILRMICAKYKVDLDKEDLFLKFLSGKVNKPEDVKNDFTKTKSDYIVTFK